VEIFYCSDSPLVLGCAALFDVGWVEGQNGGPSPQKFFVTSYLGQSSCRPAILTRNPPKHRYKLRIVAELVISSPVFVGIGHGWKTI